MRQPATCAEGANLNDNKVKSLAAGSVCFSVSEKGSLACAPHSCCFGNLKLSIRHRLCRSPIAKQWEMLSLAVTNDCQQWFRGRKSSFQMYYISQARELSRAASACSHANTVVPLRWARSWEHLPCRVGGRIWLDARRVTCHSKYYGASSRRAALHWPRCSTGIAESFP